MNQTKPLQTLLVVDSDPNSHKVLDLLLGDQYRIIPAHSVEEFLKVFGKGVDAVVLELEKLRGARDLNGTFNDFPVPVVLYTGRTPGIPKLRYGADGKIERLENPLVFDGRADAYVVKSSKPDITLLAAIDHVRSGKYDPQNLPLIQGYSPVNIEIFPRNHLIVPHYVES